MYKQIYSLAGIVNIGFFLSIWRSIGWLNIGNTSGTFFIYKSVMLNSAFKIYIHNSCFVVCCYALVPVNFTRSKVTPQARSNHTLMQLTVTWSSENWMTTFPG